LFPVLIFKIKFMKRIFSILGAFFCLISIAKAQNLKVAVISLSSNREVTTSGFQDLTIKFGLTNGDVFKVNDELERFKAYVFTDLAKEFPFRLLDEKKITENAIFQSYKTRMIPKILGIDPMDSRLTYQGYSGVSGLTKKNMDSLVLMIDSLNAAMTITVDYMIAAKAMLGNTGTAGAQAKAEICLWLPSGKRLMRLGGIGYSNISYKIALGQIVSDRTNIPEALKEASEALMKDLKENLPGQVKKLSKKLEKLQD
jgi:hypothetical protein